MKIIKLLLGIYQLILSIFCLLFIALTFVMISRTGENTQVHWLVLICALVVLGSGTAFCTMNGLYIVSGYPKVCTNIRSLKSISIFFTVFITIIFCIMLIQTDWNSFSHGTQTPQVHPLLHQEAPNFSAADINGENVQLIDLRGQYVLLDFWASWCSPCVAELPNVQDIKEMYPEDKLLVLGINKDREIDGLNQFIEDNRYTFRNIFDKDGEISSLYQVSTIPINFLIDPNGIVVASNIRGRALKKIVSKYTKD